MTKITDVAKLAGVSTATVSRYINKTGVVKPETAEAVERAIHELGYMPNMTAVGLRTRQTKKIAFFIPTLNNLYYIEFFGELNRILLKAGYTLCLFSMEESLDRLKIMLRSLSASQYDGAIVCYMDEPVVMDELARLRDRMPLVIMTASPDRKDFCSVFLDVRSASRNAVESYYEEGRKHIAFIKGGTDQSTRIIIEEKLGGYIEAVKKHGDEPIIASPHCKRDIDAANGIAAGLKGVEDFLELPEMPDAIICSLDNIAIGVCRALKTRGFRVPDDVAVVGFSGQSMTEIYSPSISTIMQPLSDMAEAVWELLGWQINTQNLGKGLKISNFRMPLKKAKPTPEPQAH